MRPLPVAIALSLLATALSAQRGRPTLDWQKRITSIDYGAVPLGKHGLDELNVGDLWRLGMGEATRWSLQMPALLGDKVVPPGEYRLRLHGLVALRQPLGRGGAAGGRAFVLPPVGR